VIKRLSVSHTLVLLERYVASLDGGLLRQLRDPLLEVPIPYVGGYHFVKKIFALYNPHRLHFPEYARLKCFSRKCHTRQNSANH
jgi:hypothetical protein